MDDIGYRKHKGGFKDGEISIFHKKVPNARATLAIELLSRWGIISVIQDGEDSAGRQKVTIMPPIDVVDRACEIADLAISEMDKRGGFLDVPEPVGDAD